MKKLLLVLALVLSVSMTVSGVASGYLPDVAGHWAASLVAALEAQGIVSGDNLGRFTPDASLTRAQIAKLFSVGLGFESDASVLSRYPSRYPDVPLWHWGRGYIESSTELGLMDGFPDGRFGPDEEVTRAQLAVLTVRAAGLAERARLARLQPTAYSDDGAVPAWARGSVFVAQQEGLMTGMPDSSFHPNRAVTKAEGTAMVFRLIHRNGGLFHLAGTLVEYDPEERSGKVRDALGQERSFVMNDDAAYLRQGDLASAEQVRLLDQVFVLLDENGRGKFLEARYQDLLVEGAVALDGGLSFNLPSGGRGYRLVQPGALVFVNGRPSRLENVSGSNQAYLVFDQTTGEARLVDAVRTTIEGLYAGVTGGDKEVRILVDQEEHRYPLAPDLIIIVDGARADLIVFMVGDEVRLAVDEAGRVVYIEVMR